VRGKAAAKVPLGTVKAKLESPVVFAQLGCEMGWWGWVGGLLTDTPFFEGQLGGRWLIVSNQFVGFTTAEGPGHSRPGKNGSRAVPGRQHSSVWTPELLNRVVSGGPEAGLS